MNEPDVPINQMEDLDCEITVEQEDGSPLDMSGINTLIYFFVHDGYRNVVAKFMKGSPASGWFTIDTSGAATGLIKFKVLSQVTKELIPGRYYGEVMVRFNSGSYVDDFYYDVIERKQYMFTVGESLISKEPVLP